MTATLDSLMLVGDLPPLLYSNIAFGDSDHDGRSEAVMYVDDNLNFQYWLLEHQGENEYELALTGPDLLPYALCDLDGDGKTDLLGQRGGQILVFESPDASSHPSQLVWSSPNLSNTVGMTTVGDTDRDGRLEIIHSVNGVSYLLIVENVGDNEYEPVYTLATGGRDHGTKAIGDFDGDGLIEIAFGESSGILRVVESFADNQWVETWRKPIGTLNAFATVAWADADGNGRSEIFVTGNGLGSFCTRVLESDGDNSFAIVSTLERPSPGAGLSFNAIGNLDGVGPPEFVMHVLNELLIYELTPQGWSEAQLVANPVPFETNYDGVHIFDANQNGRGELFWDHPGAIQSGAHSMIWEHPPVPPTDVRWSERSAGARRLVFAPNPCRAGDVVAASTPAGRAGTLVVFDVAGRVVDRMFMRPIPTLQWTPKRAGIFLLQVQDERGVPVARGRLTAIR